MRVFIKKLMHRTIRALGPLMPTGGSQEFLCKRLVPYVLDERVVPREMTMAAIRRENVLVPCNPYEFTHRMCVWCGRPFENQVISFLRRTLKPGDVFVDIGMNYGHLALPASRHVGAQGRVIGFEPNPTVCGMTKRAIELNAISNITVHECALGRESSSAVLHAASEHSGHSTLRDNELGGEFDNSVSVNVMCGDDVLAEVPEEQRIVMKIDVEGFEHEVVPGLTKTLNKNVQAVIIEISPQWLDLERISEIFQTFESAELRPHRLTDDGRMLNRVRAEDVTSQENIAFIREQAANAG